VNYIDCTTDFYTQRVSVYMRNTEDNN